MSWHLTAAHHEDGSCGFVSTSPSCFPMGIQVNGNLGLHLSCFSDRLKAARSIPKLRSVGACGTPSLWMCSKSGNHSSTRPRWLYPPRSSLRWSRRQTVGGIAPSMDSRSTIHPGISPDSFSIAEACSKRSRSPRRLSPPPKPSSASLPFHDRA